MQFNDVNEMLEQLDLLEKHHEVITSLLSEITSAAQSNHFLSKKQCSDLLNSLEKYCLLLEPIEKTCGKELPTVGILEFKEKLREYLRRTRLDAALEEANKFHLLDTTNEELVKELDEQKAVLVQLTKELEAKNTVALLQPYQSFVKLVGESNKNQASLSDDFDSIESTFSSRFLRGLWMDQFFFRSIEVSAPEIAPPAMKELLTKVNEKTSPSQEANVEKSRLGVEHSSTSQKASAEEETFSEGVPVSTAAYNDLFVNLSLEVDPGPDQPNKSVKKFIELLKRDSSGDLAFAFARTALSKVAYFSDESNLSECANKLYKRGYITKVTILSGDLVIREGYSLTQLGYSLADNKDVLNTLSKITQQSLKLFPVTPSSLSPNLALRSWFVGNYPLECQMPDAEVICRLNDENDQVFALAKGANCSLMFVSGAIMSDSVEKDINALVEISSYASEKQAQALVVVVEHRESVSLLHNLLSDRCNQNIALLFAVAEDKSELYTSDGMAVSFDSLPHYLCESKLVSISEQELTVNEEVHNTENQKTICESDENKEPVEDAEDCQNEQKSFLNPENGAHLVEDSEESVELNADCPNTANAEAEALDLIQENDASSEEKQLSDADNSITIANYLLSAPAPLQMYDEQYKLLVALIAEKSWIESVALAKTLSEATNAPSQMALYQNILHALNSPLDERHYSSNKSIKLPYDTELEKYCRIATMFWSLCFPESAYDYDLRNTYRGIGEQIVEEVSSKFPKVKSAFILLNNSILDIISNYYGGKGFSPQVLRSISADNSTVEAIKSLREQAQTLRDLPRNQIGLKGIEEFLKVTIGPTSIIGNCVRQIAQGTKDYKVVSDAFMPFSTDGINYTQDTIERFINAEWDKVNKGPGVRKLNNDSPAKNLINKSLKQRLDLLSNWLQLNSENENSIDADVAGKFKNNIHEYCKYLESSRKEMEEYLLNHEVTTEEKAGLTLLAFVFERICTIIEAADESEPFMEAQFLEFSKTPWIALSNSGRPILDKSFNSIPEMEPWRMILKHICEPKIDLEDVLEKIQSKESEWFEEYTTGNVLQKALRRVPVLYEAKYKKAFEDIETAEKEFLGRARQNCAFGRISESGKETIMMLLENQKEFFVSRNEEDENRSSHNYRHYKMLLDSLYNAQLVEFKDRQEKLQRDVKDRIAKLPTYEAEIPKSLDLVKNSIESGNLSMAEEYLTRYDTDPHSLETVNLKQIASIVNWHDRFINDADMIYEEACNKQANKNKRPTNWAINYIQGRYKNWSTPNEKASAEKLVQNWIYGKENPNTPSYLMQFMQALGFQPIEGSFERKNTGKKYGQDYAIYIGKLKPSSTRLNSYPHPVAKFGTNFGGSHPIDVNLVCIYGSKSASTLYTVLQGLDIGNNPSIVFMDGSLAVNERKNLASKFKSQTNARNPILILDRVLLVFLASLNAGDRLPAFFQCTLPYTFAQLHTLGSGPVPDEMFFGRNSDLRKITDPEGVCLVYGGRQLGKTALLKRAKSLNHKPEHKQYAFFVDLKDQGLKELIHKLNNELCIPLADNKPLLDKPCATLEELCLTLKRRSDAYDYLTILVDEADVFFREIEKDGYKHFHPIVTLRQDTNNRVKFVFAGTHNVAQLRSANDNNKDTLQLGTSLCIKPLSMVDAANLITYPLAYLGFYIDEDQVAMILNNTNRYPGVIHMFCHNLVQVLCNSYSEFYSDKAISPPYHISERQMAALFREKDLKKEVGRRVYATITVDQVDREYEYIARLLAFLEYENKDSETARLYGFTPEEIIACNKDYFELPEFMPNRTTIEKVDIVMSEMVDMGILWKKPDGSSYRFQQRDFLGYLGTKEENEEALLAYSEGYVNA